MLDNDGSGAGREEAEREARDDPIKVDKSPDPDHDKHSGPAETFSVAESSLSSRPASVSVAESSCPPSVSVESPGGDGGWRHLPPGNCGDAEPECRERDGKCRDFDRRGAGNASPDNIRRSDARRDKYRGVRTSSSNIARMSGGDESRETERNMQRELRTWLRGMSEWRHERLRLRSSVPLRRGAQSLDTHTMLEPGLKYTGDHDDTRRPHGQGHYSSIRRVFNCDY